MPKLMAIAETLLLEKVLTGNLLISRKSKAGLGLMVLAGLLALVAGGFLIVAFHIWVQAQFTPDIAALITAGAVAGLAVVAAIAGCGILKRRRLRTEAFKNDIAANIQTAIAALDDELGDQIREHPRAAVALASLAGFIIAEKVL